MKEKLKNNLPEAFPHVSFLKKEQKSDIQSWRKSKGALKKYKMRRKKANKVARMSRKRAA